jgi:hypothetical protein
MAQRPSFDMSKLSTADKILLGGSALFLIDSFLPWQRVCIEVAGFSAGCASANAWGGDASWAGILASLLATLLLLASVAGLAGVAMPPTMPMPMVMSWLAFGTALFGVLKFLLIITNEAYFFAYLGVLIALGLAYGGWMKMQEARVLPPPSVSGGTESGPYNP